MERAGSGGRRGGLVGGGGVSGSASEAGAGGKYIILDTNTIIISKELSFIAYTYTLASYLPTRLLDTLLLIPHRLSTFHARLYGNAPAASAIAGNAAGTLNYTPGQAQVGDVLRLRVSFTDGAGNPEELFSAPTGVVSSTATPEAW